MVDRSVVRLKASIVSSCRTPRPPTQPTHRLQRRPAVRLKVVGVDVVQVAGAVMPAEAEERVALDTAGGAVAGLGHLLFLVVWLIRWGVVG